MADASHEAAAAPDLVDDLHTPRPPKIARADRGAEFQRRHHRHKPASPTSERVVGHRQSSPSQAASLRYEFRDSPPAVRASYAGMNSARIERKEHVRGSIFFNM